MAFLGNNLLFAAFTFTVLLGTVYPLLNEVMTDVQISVGEPYFNRMSVPICLGILFLMGVGPALPWGGPPSRRSCRGLQSRPPSRLSSQVAASLLDSASGLPS